MKSIQYLILSAIACLSFAGCDAPLNRLPAEQAQANGDTRQFERFALPALSPSDTGSAQGALKAKERRFKLEDEQNTIDIFGAAAPGTVHVTQKQIQRTCWQAVEIPAGTGSGFIWDKSGHIVTNYHVIKNASSLTVTLFNHKSYPARIVGVEPKKDIAVLKIDAPAKELTPIPLPEDNYEIAVGQKALVIGNPYGFDHTLTTGIISAIGRDQLGVGGVTIKDMIQTDASINPGNSGGPLLDSSGKLLGMNTMIFTTSGANAGIGFAVPFMTIKRVVPQIIKTGRAQQIGLGISLLQPSDAAYIARAYGIKGVIIKAVAENSPAAKAGLKGLSQNSDGVYLGDVILSIDGKPVANYNDLYTELDSHNPGDKVNVKIKRDQKEITVPVELFILPD